MIGIGTIILFLAVLSVLVLAHEIGHFITARRLGCKVEEFGIGFPPRIFAWKRKGVEYSVNWIPLGGFVRIKGESGEHRDHDDSFSAKEAWKRLVILLAGVTMNFVLAAVLLTAGFMIGLPTAIDNNIPAGAEIRDQAVRVMSIIEGSPAQNVGLQTGDELVAIDDQVFATAAEASEIMEGKGSEAYTLLIEREGEYKEFEVRAEYLETISSDGIGVGLLTTGLVSFPFHLAVWHGLETTVYFTKEIFIALVDIVKNLIVAQELTVDVSGPVGIAVMTGEVARLGLSYLIQFTAILSINLAIINVLPFPALDGGRILFLLIEKLRGAPVNQRIEAIVHNMGFLFLMGLIVLVTYRDFVRFGDQIWGAIKGVFGV